jgi:hypothetical protein
MTLNLTQEEKEERKKLYKKAYSRQYYREQKEENNERYKDILEKAKIRYQSKKAETTSTDGGNVRKYKKRNILD